MKQRKVTSSQIEGRPNAADPDFASFLIDSWQQRLPEVDASSVPLCSTTTALGRRMELFLESVVKPKGFQLSEYRLLVTLFTSESGLTPVQLNAVLRLTSAGITKTIARIEQRGLIKRRPNPQDSRSILIELTEDGELEIRDLCAHVAAEQNKKLAWLSPEQRETALEGTRILLQALS